MPVLHITLKLNFTLFGKPHFLPGYEDSLLDSTENNNQKETFYLEPDVWVCFAIITSSCFGTVLALPSSKLDFSFYSTLIDFRLEINISCVYWALCSLTCSFYVCIMTKSHLVTLTPNPLTLVLYIFLLFILIH